MKFKQSHSVLFVSALLLLFAASVQAQVTGSGTTDTIPLWTSTTAIGNSQLFQKNGNVGLGTKTPTAKLDVVGPNNGPLVLGSNTSTSTTTTPVGAEGIASSAAGIGVVGIASSTASGSLARGVVGTSSAEGGNGVQGLATAACATYCPSGVYGITTLGGAGVNAVALNTTGASNGVQVINYSPQGVAIAAANVGGGVLFSAASGASYTTVFQVDGAGNVFIKGNLSKGSGSFKIDHPLDPANKYLSHSFVESPDMMNIYNGIVVLDAHGDATVKMPDYFQALNSEFRYQLTSIGAPGPNLYVAEEISGNHFKISGGKAGSKVSWQVTGVRQDAYANAHRIEVEEAKPAQERGRYLHPELFGATDQDAIGANNQHFQTAPVSPAVGGGM
jgi:hypothetical protein